LLVHLVKFSIFKSWH